MTDFDGNLIINGKKGLFIYPQCKSNLASIPSDTKIGGLYNHVKGTKSLRQKLSQTVNDGKSTKWNLLSKDINNDNFPIYFIITNDCINSQSIIRFYNNDNIDISCEYTSSFPIDQALNWL